MVLDIYSSYLAKTIVIIYWKIVYTDHLYKKRINTAIM